MVTWLLIYIYIYIWDNGCCSSSVTQSRGGYIEVGGRRVCVCAVSVIFVIVIVIVIASSF